MKKYVLYGTGLEGEKLLYNHFSIIDEIAYCIDSFHTGSFHGIPIVTFDEATDLQSYTIIVAAVWKTYEKIKCMLVQKGYIEYTNFFWASEFGKKLVIINANCHGAALAKFLENCGQFVKEYCIHPIPQTHMNQEKKICSVLLNRADVYIHQDIRPDNSIGYELSDEYVTRLLKDDCVNITIPNFVGMGNWIYPLQGGLDKRFYTNNGLFDVFYRDQVMEEAYDNQEIVSLEQYVSFYLNYTIEEETLVDKKEKDLLKLKKREEKWDIKVADFIEKNFRTIPCFVDHDHPSKYLMYEIGRQVAEILGVENDICIECWESHLGLPTPVLKCVIDYYGINWEVSNDKPFNIFLGYQTSQILEEYIKEYLWWYHGMIVKP
jgi:hypothetical protein